MTKIQISHIVFVLIILSPLRVLGQNEEILREINMAILTSDYTKALTLCDSAVRNNFLSPEIFYKQSIAYRSVNNYKMAHASIKHAYNLDPENLNIQIEFGKVCYTLNMLSKADSIFSNILMLDSDNYISGLYLARICFNKNEFERAFKIFESLSKIDATNNYLFRQMGVCKIKTKEAEEAIRCFERAIEIDSLDIKSYEYLARVYQALNEDDKAIKVLEKAIRLDKANSELYVLLGDIHFSRNHQYIAIPIYLKAIELGDDSPWLPKNVGIGYSRIEKYQLAKKYLLLALPYFLEPRINQLLGEIYYKLDQPDSSIMFFKAAIEQMVPEPFILFNLKIDLAKSYRKNEEFQNAIQTYEELYHMQFGKYSQSFINSVNFELAEMYDKDLNNKKKALEYYEKVLNNQGKYTDPQYVRYLESRIKKLKEELFFEKE